jgi:chemotaxis regulatin CheY-phosphate phosphatase CheZ
MSAYITQAEYEAYAAERGITVDLATIATDLVNSTDFLDRWYTFKGQPLDVAQERQLPTDQVSVAAIKNPALLCCQMQQAGLLTVDLKALAAGVVKRIMTKVDVLEKEIEYQDGTQPTSKPRTPELDRLLRPFVVGGVGLVRV